jgi:hypothetical protein
MKLIRRQPRLGPHPELLSFRCQQCGHVVTLVAEDERQPFLITLIGGAAAMWPLAARAHQTAVPVVGFFNPGTATVQTYPVEGFRRGLAEVGYSEGRNVAVEYRWADGHYNLLPELAADFVRRHVAVIVTARIRVDGIFGNDRPMYRYPAAAISAFTTAAACARGEAERKSASVKCCASGKP